MGELKNRLMLLQENGDEIFRQSRWCKAGIYALSSWKRPWRLEGGHQQEDWPDAQICRPRWGLVLARRPKEHLQRNLNRGCS